jgi:hypothetical protein
MCNHKNAGHTDLITFPTGVNSFHDELCDTIRRGMNAICVPLINVREWAGYIYGIIVKDILFCK